MLDLMNFGEIRPECVQHLLLEVMECQKPAQREEERLIRASGFEKRTLKK